MQTLHVTLGRPLTTRELAAARWELFVFHEIKDVVAVEPTVLAIDYDADEAQVDEWLAVLTGLGYADAAVLQRPIAS